MKNILIFAGIAAAIVLYFNRRSKDTAYLDDSDGAGSRYVTDAEIEAYDIRENSGEPQPVL